MSDYNPNSSDAVTSRLFERLDVQDAVLARIESAVNKTNGRVTALEKWRDVVTAKTAVISSVVSAVIGIVAWLISHS